jgi:hypothetical protein
MLQCAYSRSLRSICLAVIGLVMSLIGLNGTPVSSIARGDDILREVEERYHTATEKADADLLVVIETKIAAATEARDFDVVSELADERKAFIADHTTPSSIALRDGVKEWKLANEKALAELVKSYSARIRTLTMERKIDEAAALQALVDEIEKTGKIPDGPVPNESTSAVLPPELASQEANVVKVIKDARTEIQMTIEKMKVAAADRGDLKEVQSFQSSLDQMTETPFVSSQNVTIKRLVEKHKRLIDRELAKRDRLFDKVIGQFISEMRFEEAGKINVERLTGEVSKFGRWKVLFSGRDPATWNTDSDRWDAFARRVDSAPPNVRFLRLRRLDTNEFVCIPIGNDKLGTRFDQGNVGWGGDGVEHAKVRHVGLFRIDVRPDERGYVIVGRDGFTGYPGWGFGHRHNVDDGVAYSWNGRAILPTMFEIAVTSDSLDAAEVKALLVR